MTEDEQRAERGFTDADYWRQNDALWQALDLLNRTQYEGPMQGRLDEIHRNAIHHYHRLDDDIFTLLPEVERQRKITDRVREILEKGIG
jgi:hypothetical protein